MRKWEVTIKFSLGRTLLICLPSSSVIKMPRRIPAYSWDLKTLTQKLLPSWNFQLNINIPFIRFKNEGPASFNRIKLTYQQIHLFLPFNDGAFIYWFWALLWTITEFRFLLSSFGFNFFFTVTVENWINSPDVNRRNDGLQLKEEFPIL